MLILVHGRAGYRREGSATVRHAAGLITVTKVTQLFDMRIRLRGGAN